MRTKDSPDEPISNRLAPQKGLPRFRYSTIERQVADAHGTVRNWWWEYLKLSKDYWLVCQTSKSSAQAATIDENLARIYRMFGNVHDCTFADWWLARGSSVFQEQFEPPEVKVIQTSKRHYWVPVHRDTILLEVPIVLSRATIQKKVSNILKQYEEQRPNNRLELSRSNFPINPVRFRLHTLQLMHEVYCLHRELITKPDALRSIAGTPDQRKKWQQQYEQRANLFRIGEILGISLSNKLVTGDVANDNAKKNRMRATVSRFLRRAAQLISNVEYGKFPVFTTAAQPERRFTKRQLASHLELEPEWWSLDLTSEQTGNKVAAAKTLYYNEYGEGV
jgi:hypothetical protein